MGKFITTTNTVDEWAAGELHNLQATPNGGITLPPIYPPTFIRPTVALDMENNTAQINQPRYNNGLILEQGTQNGHTDPMFRSVNVNNVPTLWQSIVAYGNTINPIVVSEGNRRYIRLQTFPYGSNQVYQNLPIPAGSGPYTISYEIKADLRVPANEYGYMGVYAVNLYYDPQNQTIITDGSNVVTVSTPGFDFYRIRPSIHPIQNLYKVYRQSDSALLGIVISTDPINKTVTLDRTIPTSVYTVYFRHIDYYYNTPIKTVANDNNWTKESFILDAPNSLYNENGAYSGNVQIVYRIYHPSQPGTIDIAFPQVEVGRDYKTTFAEYPRSDEELIVPFGDVLDKDEGVIDFSLTPMSVQGSQFFYYPGGISTGRFLLYFDQLGRVCWDYGQVGYSTDYYADITSSIGKLLTITMRWSADKNERVLFVNGVKSDVNPFTSPDSLPNTVQLTKDCGNVINILRYSNTYRSDEEIISYHNRQSILRDKTTVLYMDFNSNIKAQSVGYRISPPISIPNIDIVGSSSVSLSGVGDLSRVEIQTSLDRNTWLPYVNGSPIPSLTRLKTVDNPLYVMTIINILDVSQSTWVDSMAVEVDWIVPGVEYIAREAKDNYSMLPIGDRYSMWELLDDETDDEERG